MPGTSHAGFYTTTELRAGSQVVTEIDVGIDPENRPFSVEAWVRFDALKNTTILYTADFAFGIIDDAGRLFAHVDRAAGNGFYTDSDVTVATGEWQFIAATWDRQKINMYLNGKHVGAHTPKSPPKNPPTGRSTVMGGGLIGALRSIRVSGAALTAAQVKENMFQPPSQQYLAAFDFTQSPPRDTTAGNRSLTLVGDASVVRHANAVRLYDSAYCQPVRDQTVNPGGKDAADYTIAAWVWIDLPSPHQTVFDNGNLEDEGVSLYLHYQEDTKSFDLVSRVAHSGQHTSYAATTRVPLQRWTNVATVSTDGHVTMYVDGVEAGSGAFDQIVKDTPGNSLLGAALQEGQPAAATSIQGYLSELNVWNRGLSAAEVAQYQREDPLLSDGLIAHYSFLGEPVRNAVTGQPVGLCDGAEVTTHVAPAPAMSTVDAATVAELAALPIETRDGDEEFLTTARAAVSTATHAPRAESIANALASDLELAPTLVRPDELAGFEAAIRAAWAEVENTMRTDPLANGFLLTEHEHNGEWVLVQHGSQKSHIVMRVDAELVNDCMRWRLKVIWTAVSGFLSVLGITATATTAVRNFIRTRILSNQSLVLAMFVGAHPGALGLYVALKALNAYGVLWPLTRMLISSLGWWALGTILTRLAAFFTGLEAATVLVSLATAAFSFANAVAAKPPGCSLYDPS